MAKRVKDKALLRRHLGNRKKAAKACMPLSLRLVSEKVSRGFGPRHFVGCPDGFVSVSKTEYIGIVKLPDGEEVIFGLLEQGPGLFEPMPHERLVAKARCPVTPGYLNQPVGTLRAPTPEQMPQVIDQAYQMLLQC